MPRTRRVVGTRRSIMGGIRLELPVRRTPKLINMYAVARIRGNFLPVKILIVSSPKDRMKASAENIEDTA